MFQKGFATLEVILMVMVIGILASIAVPRFTSVTTAANTAKIQSDLSTIDTAIAIYTMEKGTADAPPTLGAEGNLKNYIQDIGNLKPPTGKCYLDGVEHNISDSSYEITPYTTGEGTSAVTEYRATLDDNTAGHFTNKSSGNSGGNTQPGE